jgi:hypothetical protein
MFTAPTYAQTISVKMNIKITPTVSVLIHHLQGIYKLCWLKLRIIKMIKYNIFVCRYDKILVNVAAYVISGLVCVVRLSGVKSKLQPTHNVNSLKMVYQHRNMSE